MQEGNRIALITGGNRGLGLETARQLAQRGLRIIVTSRREAEGYAAAQELIAEGLTCEFRPLDVASDASVGTLRASLEADRLTIDILVNNAGVALRGFNADVVRRTLAVNYFGAARVTDALLPLMPDGGTVVMVSSALGEISNYRAELKKRLLDPALARGEIDALMRSLTNYVEHGVHAEAGWPASAYNASKAGLNALTRVYARDLAPRRIRVNAVCPGWVRTDMGGRSATRGVEEGAASIVWGALLDATTTGGFFRDGEAIPW
ncbi:MAG: SDR family NAD(P)-dependent oxidoreductase [Candidatus Krumholzibacteria bacterium]|nr:SDR family NAD(P)-dependent oxidoreductase [Candidatus Krumholzibacteria bacterium]MDH4338263.1 SDR family NAD(P)-dependent oxidoreductase [Candidatus Krumholzibacteria bacterium]MDH5271061.1 SDR family NAD(P)-dependent oxidoreductase [Candidatus Krumholzibacteria bacterium]